MLMKVQDTMTAEASAPDRDEGVPVSVKIRERVQAARKRFHANDNIAEFIQPGELEKLLDEVTDKMKGVLGSLVIYTDNDNNTADTARRVADMIFDLNRDAGTALVLVTHDAELASRCSQVVRLRNGQRVEP